MSGQESANQGITLSGDGARRRVEVRFVHRVSNSGGVHFEALTAQGQDNLEPEELCLL